MSLEFLASKIRTANAPPRATWWPRHGMLLNRFLSIYGRRPEAHLEGLRGAVDAQAAEWERFIPETCAHGLMEKHARLELALVEAARAGFKDTIERIGDMMISVVDEQAKDLAARVPNLPARQLRYLLLGHAGLFISRVEHAIAREESRKCQEEAEANELALAAFTMEWF